MVCCAINDSAKSGHSIKEGDWTGEGGMPALRILLLMGREKLNVCVRVGVTIYAACKRQMAFAVN